MQALLETLFSLFFIAFTLYLGYEMFTKSDAFMFKLYSILSFTVGIGLGFYLMIRSINIWTEGKIVYGTLSGISIILSELALTVFLFGLFYLVNYRYRINRSTLNYTVYGLLALRTVLLLIPQNNWFAEGQSMVLMFFEFITFALVGALIALLAKTKSASFFDKTLDKLYLFIGLLVVAYGIFFFLRGLPYITIVIIAVVALFIYYFYLDFTNYAKHQK